MWRMIQAQNPYLLAVFIVIFYWLTLSADFNTTISPGGCSQGSPST